MSRPGGVAGDPVRAFVERASSTWTGDQGSHRIRKTSEGPRLRCQDPARGHPDPKEGPEGPDGEESLLDVSLQPAMRTADPACVRSASYSGAPTSGPRTVR